MESIADLDNLYLAYYKASKGKQDKSEVISFAKKLDENIRTLRNKLLSNDFEVGRYRYFTIFYPKKRLICAASFPERVIHHAVMNVCHPFFERNLINDTYATRIGKGTYAAIDKALKAMSRYQFVVKLDVRKYFDNISHEILKSKIRHLFKDTQLVLLLDQIIDSYCVTEKKGVPIGNLTSQYFANYYLSELDHLAKEVLRIPVYLRYMDDILFFGNDKSLLKKQIDCLNQCVTNLDLRLKPPIISSTEVGVTFLGYRICHHIISLDARSRNRLKRKLKSYSFNYENRKWSESEYNAHLLPLLAFASKAYTKHMRRRLII